MSDVRLSAFYFFYFAAVGTMVPYWGLYLESAGVDAFRIGLFVTLVTSVKIVAPPLWAWASDRSAQPLRIVRWTALGAILCFLLVFFSTHYLWLVVSMFGFNFFWAAQLPQIDAVALKLLGERRHRYGRLRLWGSIGFVVAVLCSGWLVDQHGVRVILVLLLAMYMATLFITLGVDEPDVRAKVKNLSLPRWRPGQVTCMFWLMGFLMQASHGPFYTFFTIYINDLGYSSSVAGLLWALGVICEVGIFFVMHHVLARLSVPWILMLSFVIACVRWVLLGLYGESLSVLVFTQTLHAVTFGAWHAASIQFIHHHFPQHMQHRGQALHGSLCFALGTAFGGGIAGYVWQGYGAKSAWLAAAAMAALAAGLALWLIFKRNAWQVR